MNVGSAPVSTQSCADYKASQNRTAFLLGLYIELPAVDAIHEPLVRLSVMLSIPKLVLLDMALARLGEYDVERSLLPPKGSLAHESLDPASRQRCFMVNFLHGRELEKIRTIAGLLWEGQTELAAWYQTGKAIGALVNVCDRETPNPDAVSFAKKSLNQARSYWGTETHAESREGLFDWISQWDGNPERSDCATDITTRAFSSSIATNQIEGERKELRAVEALASQIQDRPEDTRSKEQRERDDRDQFMYEKFFAGFDAAEIRELLEKEIKEKHRLWEEIPKGSDLRSVANQYAVRFKKEPIPPGAPGRPRAKNRK